MSDNSNGTTRPSSCAATVGDHFLRRVAAGGPSDYVVHDATIEEMLQVVFSVSLLGALGGYISQLTKAVQSVSE
jgi:hypothetical protein